jgi:hypothetical protein
MKYKNKLVMLLFTLVLSTSVCLYAGKKGDKGAEACSEGSRTICGIKIDCSGPVKTADGGTSHKAGSTNCMTYQLPQSCAGGSTYTCGTVAVLGPE